MSSARFTDLPARALSVLIAAPIVLFAVWTGGLFFDLVIGLAIILGMYEWLRLHQQSPSILCEGLNFLALVAIWWLCSLGLYGFACLTLVAICGFGYSLYERAKLENATWIAFGLPYLGSAMIALMALGNDETARHNVLVYYLLLTVWAADTGAYALGRIIGGPKLAPIISPSKTWAGLLGAIGGAVFIGWVFDTYIFSLPNADLIIIAGVMGAAAQAGDLFESYVKRRAGVKDSGRILPGHGGILDRIDGLIVAAIVLALWYYVWSYAPFNHFTAAA